jgi:DAK2 domain fusion protein YloV
MKAGQEILLKTTQMLPQLKEAGVVDAGGKGLLIFLEAAAQGVYKTGEVSLREISAGRSPDGQAVTTADFARLATSDIKFAYCTEFFINLNAPEALEKSEHGLKLFLDNIGDSIVVVGDDDIIKVHVHTNHPGDVLEKAMTYGFLSNLKIENMKLQHTNLIEGDAFKTVAASVVSPDTAPVGSPFSSAYSDADAPVKAEPPKEAGIVAVAMGEGMAKLFKDLGADAVIEGGQTMNPSTEDFLDAIGKLTAKSIILLPNNKNVILAAQQAAKLYKEKTVYTIPSRTMPEGFAAMINYLSVLPVEEMTQNMTEAVNEVKTGQITLAVRDTVLNGKTIKQGDILCMESDDIKIVSEDMEDGAVELLEGMTTEGSEMVTIYYGADVTEDDAARIKNRLIAQKPEVEVELHNGGQPLYHYIFSVE